MKAVRHPTFVRIVSKLDEVVKRVGSDGRKAVEYVTPVLDDLIRNDEWLEKRFTHPPERRSPSALPPNSMYLLHGPPDASYSIISTVWPIGQRTFPHDHSTWAVIGMIHGRERQTRYKRIDDGSKPGFAQLKEIGSYETAEAEMDYVIQPRDIHEVENVSSEPSVSIHVYGCDIGNVKRRKYDTSKMIVEEWVSGYDALPA